MGRLTKFFKEHVN
jgi:hypothetical protein